MTGDYTLIRRIKLGGSSEIYLARSPAGSFVAVKRLLPGVADDPDMVTMFGAEAELMAVLDHPRVLRLVDGRQALGSTSPFIVYEFLDGVDLASLRRRAIAVGGLLPAIFVAAVGAQAADALAYVHSTARRIIHRDVSPHNLMLLRGGRLKLIDFGIAKFDGSPCHTATGILKGKRAYMSPEQVSSDRLDGRSDVFSLGATLYELATCTRLFKAASPMESLRLIQQAVVPPILERAPDLDPDVARWIERCLARRAQARPSAQEVARGLTAIAEAQGRDLETEARATFEQLYPVGAPAPHTAGDDLQHYLSTLQSAEMDGQETTDQLGHSNATMLGGA